MSFSNVLYEKRAGFLNYFLKSFVNLLIINLINNKKLSMNIINKKNNVVLILRKIASVLLIASVFGGGAFMANLANANDSTFEIPTCPFEEQEGRTIVRFSDKKIVSRWSQEDSESGPVAVNLLAGSYKVSLFSYDGYEGRENVFLQPKESWLAVLKDGDSVIAQSSPIDDLEDFIERATKMQIVNEELALDQNVNSVSALHIAYPDESSPNSVFPVCASFDLLSLKEEPNHLPIITLIGSTTVNLIVGENFVDPGATANDDEDGDITADIIVGGDEVDTTKSGTYIITYNVNDSQGAAADEVVRTVIVAESSGGGGGGGSSSSSSSESSSSSSGGGGGGGGVGGDTEEVVTTGGGSGITFGVARRVLPPVSAAVSVATSTNALQIQSSASAGQCSYLNDYLKIGRDNDRMEVLKLQAFLSAIEHFNVPMTGVFDQATFDAVSDFQKKYKEDILAPWGYDVPTGYVYITTKNKINEIFCGSKIPLSDEQKAEIEKVKTYIKEFGNTEGSEGSSSQGIDGDIGFGVENVNESDEDLDGEKEITNLAAGVSFIKSPMAFILDNKVTVAIIGMAITLLVYMFSFRGSKI